MVDLDLDSSVVEWVLEYPEVQGVLDALGIDQTCAGKSLGYVCRQVGREPHFVLKQLLAAIEDQSTANE